MTHKSYTIKVGLTVLKIHFEQHILEGIELEYILWWYILVSTKRPRKVEQNYTVQIINNSVFPNLLISKKSKKHPNLMICLKILYV